LAPLDISGVVVLMEGGQEPTILPASKLKATNKRLAFCGKHQVPGEPKNIQKKHFI